MTTGCENCDVDALGRAELDWLHALLFAIALRVADTGRLPSTRALNKLHKLPINTPVARCFLRLCKLLALRVAHWKRKDDLRWEFTTNGRRLGSFEFDHRAITRLFLGIAPERRNFDRPHSTTLLAVTCLCRVDAKI